MAWQGFGGWKKSLFGDMHAYGEEGGRFCTKQKSIMQRWPALAAKGAEFVMPTVKWPQNLIRNREASRRFYVDVMEFKEGFHPPFKFPGIWLYIGRDESDSGVVRIIGVDTNDSSDCEFSVKGLTGWQRVPCANSSHWRQAACV